MNTHRTQVIWVGRNDAVSRMTTVPGNIAAIISTGRTGKYLVLGVTNNSAEPSGSTGYNDIVALNRHLEGLYGERYIDIRAYLVEHGLSDAGIEPTATDMANLAADIIPASLRSDATHLNAAGYTVVGNQIYNKVLSLGWV